MPVARAGGLPPGQSAIVVAFDGVVAGTLAPRLAALTGALSRVMGANQLVAESFGTEAIAGRTFAEAARLVIASSTAAAEETETFVDLIALDASRAYAAVLAQGVTIDTAVVHWLERQAMRSVRIVARADGTREQTSTILAMSGMGSLFSFVRCSDDMPRAVGMSVVESAWRAIGARLDSAVIPRERRSAVEPSACGAEAAGAHVGVVHRGTAELPATS